MGKVTTYTYDNNGNKLTEAINGHTTSYQYDAMNRVILITYPTTPVSTTSYTYDFRGNVIDATDQSGHITHNEYDFAGRLVAVTVGFGTADASRRTTAYDAANRKISETDANNHATIYNYDEANRLTGVLDAKNQTTRYVYDDGGNRISMTDPNLHTTQYQYDVRRRLRKTIYHDTTFTTQSYNGAGQLASVTDQAGKVANYNYDDAEQLVNVVQANHPDPAHNTTVDAYDPHGNLMTLTDANSHTTTTLFDLLDRRSSLTLPSGGPAATSTYDIAGNQLTFTDFLGKTTTYSYDGVNRLIAKTPDAGLAEPVVSFTYTGTGKRASMIDASGATTYTYDNQDRLKTKVTPQGTLTYTYDAAGNVASINSSNPNGASVNYTWDELNRLASVIDNRLPPSQNMTTYAYDPASNLATVTYPNGVQSSFTYDSLNRLTTLPITKASTIASYTYGFGLAGNRQSLIEQGGRSVTYTYDGIYRLTNETISSDPNGKNGTASYGLDLVGNRLSQTSTLTGIATGTYTYDANDGLSTEAYDSNGNTVVSGARTFRYDFENRLKDMNNGQARIVYDGDGNRVSKNVGATATLYLVDDLNPTGYAQVIEEVVSGGVQRTYTYGTSRISQNQLINSTWTPSFYVYDHCCPRFSAIDFSVLRTQNIAPP
jgi:YD repeat-containing protein